MAQSHWPVQQERTTGAADVLAGRSKRRDVRRVPVKAAHVAGARRVRKRRVTPSQEHSEAKRISRVKDTEPKSEVAEGASTSAEDTDDEVSGETVEKMGSCYSVDHATGVSTVLRLCRVTSRLQRVTLRARL